MVPRSSRTAACAVVLALATAACAGETDPDDASTGSAIASSHPDASRARSVGQLLVQKVLTKGKAGPNNYCTATVVAPRVVVTSAACFVFPTGVWSMQTIPLRRTDLDARDDGSVFGSFAPGPAMDLTQLLAENVSAPEVLVPEGLEGADAETLAQKSLAVLRLTADVPGLVPLELGEAPAEGTRVTIWGYGCDPERAGYGLRTRPLDWGEWKGWFGTDFRCGAGDTGAAVLDRQGRLVGIATRTGDVLPLRGRLLADLRARL